MFIVSSSGMYIAVANNTAQAYQDNIIIQVFDPVRILSFSNLVGNANGNYTAGSNNAYAIISLGGAQLAGTARQIGQIISSSFDKKTSEAEQPLSPGLVDSLRSPIVNDSSYRLSSLSCSGQDEYHEVGVLVMLRAPCDDSRALSVLVTSLALPKRFMEMPSSPDSNACGRGFSSAITVASIPGMNTAVLGECGSTAGHAYASHPAGAEGLPLTASVTSLDKTTIFRVSVWVTLARGHTDNDSDSSRQSKDGAPSYSQVIAHSKVRPTASPPVERYFYIAIFARISGGSSSCTD